MSDEINPKTTTHFGFSEVPLKEKVNKVADVFHSVADKYDLMNDLMSLGMHRLWKRFTLERVQARPGQIILDLAGGTGDLARALSKKVGPTGKVILADINESMLQKGRQRLIDEGLMNIDVVQADAEKLPFPNNYFDSVTMAFGLRNVTNKREALRSIQRVIKPGGKLLVLEFSKPVMPLLNTLYDKYSFHLIPKIGDWVTGDKASYQYLVESIRMHPDQEALKRMFEESGFEETTYHNLSAGIVALHIGFKF